MKKPLARTKIELWDNAEDYIKHGMNPFRKLMWMLTDYKVYHRVQLLVKTNSFRSRGFYDGYAKKIVMCVGDIKESLRQTYSEMSEEEAEQTNKEFSFALQFYYTLIHEFIHQSGVEQGDKDGGHHINMDKLRAVHPSLRELFEGLLVLKNSGDAFERYAKEDGGDDG